MSRQLRHSVARLLVNQLSSAGADQCSGNKLARLIVTRNAVKHFNQDTAQFAIPLRTLERQLNINTDTSKLKLPENIQFENRDILIKTPHGKFVESIVESVIKDRETYGHGFETHRFIKTKLDVEERSGAERVLIEFGSPNVAKPLHAGHLRSAIIGQFVANVNRAVGNSICRMSYIGDWGTQFGLLAVGFHKFGDETRLAANAVEHLEDLYVKVNAVVDKEGFEGETYLEALKFMCKLEAGDEEALNLWSRFRKLTVGSSVDVFRRLGVEFDQMEYESDYVKASCELCRNLQKDGLMKYDDHNVGFIPTEKSNIILKKSDGTSLYLSRDVAAFLERFKRYKFDRVHYVVDSGQAAHFQKMLKVLDLMGCNVNEDNFHIPFGRVKGMSTRKGNIVHLNDIIDEAKQRMFQILTEKSTTKTQNPEYVAENLALSAIFIQDLKEKRQKDYEFNWERMLSNKGATGPFLQYGHARLATLEGHFQHYLDSNYEPNYEILLEKEALRLAQHLAKFEPVLNEVYHTLEPHTLVHYLLDLVSLSNNALVNLSIKDSARDLAIPRMRLFHSCRLVLSNGIRLLGLKPLFEM